ncbi:MAG TPA: cytochrome c oxidase assembly protein [Shinella sp.]|jgi:putative membrane protein|uniref:cytochrome c oxidase assembly protein n=1 Tax=Shinella sp. TaxID=1870904 RepID=UPI002E1303C1|nr:cytochrome c oxidase assembly protein [Shinella sp.]
MRTIALPAGFGLLGLALVLGFGAGSFTVHMVAHMGIVAVAAPLIAYGLVGTRRDPLARWNWMTPMLASLIELVVVWFWHMPVLRAAADASLVLLLVEQASFLAAGLLLWTTCLRPGDGRLAGTIGLLFTSMHMTLLGVLLALAPRPLYGDGAVTCFGIPLSAAADQQIGGVVMLMVGALSYLAGGVALLAGLLREDGPQPAEGPRC